MKSAYVAAAILCLSLPGGLAAAEPRLPAALRPLPASPAFT